MSIKINTRFGEIVTSQALNEKIDTLFGENAIISGFDVTRETDTSVCIAPGKAIVCGASIEEDRDTTTINIDSNLLIKKDLFVVIHYIHDSKQARFKIVELLEANMVVLAKLTMLNSTISEIACAEKTGQLKELSSIAKDLETNLLDTQLLSVTGDEIKLQNSCPGKTANIKVKGKTKQNLVKTPNKEVLISGEMAIDEKCSHQINDSKAGCVDVVIKGRTLQNLAGEPIGLFGGATYENGKGVMSSESVGSSIRISNNLIKSNSVYTVFMNVLKNTTVGEAIKIEILGGSMAGKEFVNVPNGAIGRIRMVVNGLENINSKTYTNIWKRPDFPGEFEFDSFMILEGDWTNTPLEELPYIEGIAGVGDKSKNLFDGKWAVGALNSSNGNEVESSVELRSEYLEVESETTYYLSNDGKLRGTNVLEFDKNKMFIKCNASVHLFTTGGTTKYIRVFGNDNDRDKFQIEKGTVPTSYEPYYDGHKIEILSSGKNLFKATKSTKPIHNTSEVNIINSNSVEIVSVKNTWASGCFILNCKPNTKYYFSCNAKKVFNEGGIYIRVYDKKTHTIIKELLNSGVIENDSYFNKSFTTPSELTNCYVGVQLYCSRDGGSNTNGGRWVYDNIILEEGNSTSYIPYQEDKTQILLQEPLHSLPNGVCDEITTDGELIRRVGKVILDGSEDWLIHNINSQGLVNFKIYFKNNSGGLRDSMCENLPLGKLIADETNETYLINNTTIFIRKFQTSIATVQDLKIWLSQNPVTIYYLLPTPTITPLDMQVVLPNGVYDKVCDDGVERRIKKIILNGSEDWKYNNLTASPDTILKFILDISDIKVDSIPKSDRFKSLKYLGGHQLNDEFVMSHLTNKEIAFSVKVSRLSSPDSNGFKQWLSENPTTVWYELEEPYKESYEYNKPRLSTYAEITYMSSDTKVMPKIKVDSKGEKYPALLKPSTKYTVSIASADGDANLDLDLGGVKVTIPRAQYRAEITTPETLTHNNLYVAGWNTKIRDVMILHGSDSNDYIDGIISNGELCENGKYNVEVRSVGENLANPQNTYSSMYGTDKCFTVKYRKDDKFYIQCDGTVNANGFALGLNLYNLKPGVKYKVGYKIDGIDAPVRYAYKGENSLWTQGTYISISDNLFICPRDTTTVCLGLCYVPANTKREIIISDIVVKENVDSVTFEPYKEHTASIYLDEPLRSLPSGVCDEIVGNKLIRRVGKRIFDGDESFNVGGGIDSTENHFKFYNRIAGRKVENKQSIDFLCDTFKVEWQSNRHIDDEFVSFDGWNENIVFSIKKSRLVDSSLDSAKQWLKLNPTTVYYELETPIVTDITEDLNVRTYEDVTYISTVGPVKADLEFKTPMNLRAIINQTADRITEAEKLVDELLLPNIVEVDYERTLLEFDYEVSKFNLEGDE